MIVALVVFMFLLVPQGIYRWTDGSIYEGSWTDNVIDGPGCYLANDGRSFKGQWSDRRDGDFGMAIFFFDLGGVENLKILASLYFDMPFGSEIMETSFFWWCRIPWFMEWAVMSEALRVWQFDKLLQRFLSSIFHILTQWRMMRLYPRVDTPFDIRFPRNGPVDVGAHLRKTAQHDGNCMES